MFEFSFKKIDGHETKSNIENSIETNLCSIYNEFEYTRWTKTYFWCSNWLAPRKSVKYIQCDWIAECWECLCLTIYYMSYHSFPYNLNHIKKFNWISLANKFGIRKKLTRRKNWFLFSTQLVRRWTCIDVNRFFSLEIFNESKTLTWKLEHDQNAFRTCFSLTFFALIHKKHTT